MTVSVPEAMPHDRPPPMSVADALGLDVLNTRAAPWGSVVEWLGDGADLLAWLDAAGLVSAEVCEVMRADPGLDAVAAEARALRDWFRGFVDAHRGSPLGRAALLGLEKLNALLARDQAYGEIVAADPDQGAGLRWRWRQRWRTADDLLLPIARAMADLVCEADFRLIKRCEATACTMLFLDKTKGHARRWCSMATCGNRSKQAAHRARTRDASAG